MSRPREWAGHCYELKHQKVHWTVDLRKRQLRGHTELHVVSAPKHTQLQSPTPPALFFFFLLSPLFSFLSFSIRATNRIIARSLSGD